MPVNGNRAHGDHHSARGGSTEHTADNPVEVTIKPGVGTPAVVTARIANTFEFGELGLIKSLEGDAASYAAGRAFGVEVSCALPDASGNPTDLVLHKTFQVGADAPVTIRPLPVNSQCWAEEVDTGGAAEAVVDHDSADNPVVITPDGEGEAATITVTNTFPAATLTVTKHVVNGGSGPYDLSLACTTEHGQVVLAPDDSSFQLNDGTQREISVPDGATCTVAEENVPSGATVTYTASDGGEDGEVVLDGSASVHVTNTFEPSDGRPGPQRQPGEDQLPSTGAGSWAMFGLVGVALLLAGGVLLYVARRRRLGRGRGELMITYSRRRVSESRRFCGASFDLRNPRDHPRPLHDRAGGHAGAGQLVRQHPARRVRDRWQLLPGIRQRLDGRQPDRPAGRRLGHRLGRAVPDGTGSGNDATLLKGSHENDPLGEWEPRTSGSPQGSADIDNVWTYNQTVDGDVYAYVAWDRATTPGQVTWFLELNQKPNVVNDNGVSVP